MPEALELPSLTAAAARAASDDDIPAAAALLRQAVELQTATLGPDHPDLATTLNNLALMLERLGHVKEAGQCYRRAHTIAAAALGPDDPVVQVSRANLDAFRATYAQPEEGDDSAPIDPSVWGELGDFPAAVGKPASQGDVEPEPGTVPVSVGAAGTLPVSVPETALELTAEPGPEPRLPATPRPEPEPELTLEFAPTPVRVAAPHPAGRYASPATRNTRSPVLAFLVATVLLSVVAVWWWGRSDTPVVSGTAAPAITPPAVAPPADPPAASVPTEPPREAPPATAPVSAGPAAASKASPPASTTSRPVNGRLGVADARLCSALSRARNPWACEAAGDPVRSGSVYFYTRVRASRDATIRHRWSRNGRVVQDVRLRIRANPTDGFRTFSRQTVSGLGAGAWVVSLLGPDGTVLDEKTFEVR